MTQPYQQSCHVALRLRARTPQEIRKEDPIVWNIQSPTTVRIDPKFLSQFNFQNDHVDCENDENAFLHQGKNNDASSLYYWNSVNNQGRMAQQLKFNFNECYSYESNNQEVYNRSIKRLVQSSMKGVTGMAIFYGSTNSGKTETLIGADQQNQSFFGDKNNSQSSRFKYGQSDRSSPNGGNGDNLIKAYGILGKTASDLCWSQSESNRKFVRFSALCIFDEQIYDLLNQEQLDPLQYHQEQYQIPRSVSSERFCKSKPHHLFLSKVNTSMHSKSPSQKNQREQIPILASICGGKQELISNQESAYQLIKRSQEVKEKLNSTGVITRSNSHTIFQFSITSLHKDATQSKGISGNSPSFGMRQHQQIQQLQYSQQQRQTILGYKESVSTKSSNSQSSNSNSSPYSQHQHQHHFQGSWQSKSPSFSGGEAVAHNFLNDTSNALSNFNITVSSLSFIESAGCQNLLQRQNLSCSKATKSLEALWSCIMSNQSQSDKMNQSAINPLLKLVNKENSKIQCSIVISISPVMGQIKNAFHSVALGKSALRLSFKPLRNIIASQSAMTSLLQSYQQALTAKSKQQSMASNRASAYNSSSASASSSSRTGLNKRHIVTTAVTPNNLIIKSSRHSPAPPSPWGQASPWICTLLQQKIKRLEQRIKRQNERFYNLLQNKIHNPESSQKPLLLKEKYRAQIQDDDSLFFNNIGNIQISQVIKKKIFHNKISKQKRSKKQIAQQYALNNALKQKDVQILIAQQKMMFLFDSVKLKNKQYAKLIDILRKTKERLDGKQFLIQKVSQSLNFHKQRADIMRCKLEFFQSLNPVLLSRINNQQIAALQNHYSYLQERLKEEKARRIYKQKIDSLKQQIKRLRTNNEERKKQERNLRRNHQHHRIPDILPGVPAPSLCNQTQDSLLQEMLRGINSPGGDNLTNSPIPPPPSSAQQQQQSDNMQQQNGDLSQQQNLQQSQLNQSSAIMNESGIQNSQASYATDRYLQLGVRNEQMSFEDSAMNEDSMNASPFSRFAADNSYFQRIFSELFLGGSGQNQLDESQNAQLVQNGQYNDENNKRKGDQQNKQQQSGRGNRQKQRNVGRRKTAEKIVDDISYLDDDGGQDIYNDVQKLLDQEQKKQNNQEQQQNLKSQNKIDEVNSNNFAIFKNNKITSAIDDGKITRSTDKECEQYLANNFFAPSEKIKNLQILINQDKKQALLQQNKQEEEETNSSNELFRMHGALQGYASFQEEIQDSMNLTVEGLGEILRSGRQGGLKQDKQQPQKQSRNQLFIADQDQKQKQILIQTDSMIQSQLQDPIYQQPSELIFSPKMPQIKNITKFAAPPTSTSQRNNNMHIFNQLNNSEILISSGQAGVKQQNYFLHDFNSKQNEDINHNQSVRSKLALDNDNTNSKKKLFDEWSFIKSRNGGAVAVDRSRTFQQKPKQKILKNPLFSSWIQAKKNDNRFQSQFPENKHQKQVVEIVGTNNAPIFSCGSHHSSQRSSSRGDKVKRIIQQGLAPDHRLIIQKTVKGSKNDSKNSSTTSSTGLGKGRKLIPNKLGGVSLNQSGMKITSPTNKFVNNINILGGKNMKFQALSRSDNNSEQSSTKDLQQSQYRKLQIKNQYLNNPRSSNTSNDRVHDLNTSAVVYGNQQTYSNSNSKQQIFQANNNNSFSTIATVSKGNGLKKSNTAKNNGTLNKMHKITKQLAQQTKKKVPSGGALTSNPHIGKPQLKFDVSQPYNLERRKIEHTPPPPGSKNQSFKLLESALGKVPLQKMPGKYAESSSNKKFKNLIGDQKYMNIDGIKSMINPQTPTGQTTMTKFNISAIGGSANKKQGLKGNILSSSSQIMSSKKR